MELTRFSSFLFLCDEMVDSASSVSLITHCSSHPPPTTTSPIVDWSFHNIVVIPFRVPSLKLLNIWVSLQTKEQFIEKATKMVESEVEQWVVSDCREREICVFKCCRRSYWYCEICTQNYTLFICTSLFECIFIQLLYNIFCAISYFCCRAAATLSVESLPLHWILYLRCLPYIPWHSYIMNHQLVVLKSRGKPEISPQASAEQVW